MHLWSLHPKYLDKNELLLTWRTGLKALKLLSNDDTKNNFYPEISRFRMLNRPKTAIILYLRAIVSEANKRNISIDDSMLPSPPQTASFKIPINSAEIEYEWKLLRRNQARHNSKPLQVKTDQLHHDLHPLFYLRRSNKIPNWQRLMH